MRVARALGVAALAACSGAGERPDAARDASSDSGHDAADSGADAAGDDGGLDASVDDGGLDAGADAEGVDARFDAPLGPDAAWLDAPYDAVADAGTGTDAWPEPVFELETFSDTCVPEWDSPDVPDVAPAEPPVGPFPRQLWRWFCTGSSR